MTDAFNPERLAQARRRRGLSKVAIARAVGLTPRSLLNYESGRTAPANLPALAQALGVPVAFFGRDTPESIEPSDPTFRALSTMSAGQRDAVLAAAEWAVELDMRCIRQRFYVPAPAVPRLDSDPEFAAVMVRVEWGLGVGPIAQMVHILESRGVRVFSLDGDDRRAGSFSLWRHGVPYVFLDPTVSGERGRFDAARELGHLVMHRDYGLTAGSLRVEMARAAARFARAFLMPPETVRPVAPSAPSADAVKRLKRRWGVSVMAVARRLIELGLMGTEWKSRAVLTAMTARGWRKDEPDPIGREGSSVCEQVVAHLVEQGLTLAHLAADLDLFVDDVAGLMFGASTAPTPKRQRWAPRVVVGGAA